MGALGDAADFMRCGFVEGDGKPSWISSSDLTSENDWYWAILFMLHGRYRYTVISTAQVIASLGFWSMSPSDPVYPRQATGLTSTFAPALLWYKP